MSNRIEKTTELRAPVSKVWQALTDSQQFGAWFGVILDAPFVLGQTARGQITYPGFEHVVWEARIVAIEPEALFAFTWHPYAVETDVDYSSETPTRVEFRLEPVATGTRLTIVESGFDAVPAHRRSEALRMNDGGWTAQVENIRAHVET